MKTELKPCPFCGQDAKTTVIDSDYVRCSNHMHCPLASLGFSMNKKTWNNRYENIYLRIAINGLDKITECRGLHTNPRIIAKRTLNELKECQ